MIDRISPEDIVEARELIRSWGDELREMDRVQLAEELIRIAGSDDPGSLPLGNSASILRRAWDIATERKRMRATIESLRAALAKVEWVDQNTNVATCNCWCDKFTDTCPACNACQECDDGHRSRCTTALALTGAK